MPSAPVKFASVKFQSTTDTRASSRPETTSALSKLASSLTLAAMSLGYGVVQLDVTIVNTALNAIGMSLGGGVSELQWVVSPYTIAFSPVILTAGPPCDRNGAQRVFLAGFLLFSLAAVGRAPARHCPVPLPGPFGPGV